MSNPKQHKQNETLPELLAQLPKKAFVAPQGYFEAFPERLETLLLWNKQPVMVAPETYFDTFLPKLEQLLLLDKKEPFSADDKYFDALRDAAEQLVLLKKQSPFVLPDLYFERLQQQLYDKLNHTKGDSKGTRVISLQQVIGIASAACVVAAVIYLFSGNGQLTETLTAFEGTKTTLPAVGKAIPEKEHAPAANLAIQIKKETPKLTKLPVKPITPIVAPHQYAFVFPETSSEIEKQELIQALEEFLIAENTDESLLTETLK